MFSRIIHSHPAPGCTGRVQRHNYTEDQWAAHPIFDEHQRHCLDRGESYQLYDRIYVNLDRRLLHPLLPRDCGDGSMTAARPFPRKRVSPYTREDLSCARHVLTHAHKFTTLDPVERGEIMALAWSILQKDRALRPQPPLKPLGPTARILRVPLAVFQAGPATLRRRLHPGPDQGPDQGPVHHITPHPASPATPKDAA